MLNDLLFRNSIKIMNINIMENKTNPPIPISNNVLLIAMVLDLPILKSRYCTKMSEVWLTCWSC